MKETSKLKLQGKLERPISDWKDDMTVDLRSTLAYVGVDAAILGYLSDEQTKAVVRALLHLVDKHHDRA